MPAKPMREAIERELARWNVRYRFGEGGRHRRVIVETPTGTEFFMPYTTAKKVDPRGIRNWVTRIRRVLESHGVDRC